jgi:hypothetical protein
LIGKIQGSRTRFFMVQAEEVRRVVSSPEKEDAPGKVFPLQALREPSAAPHRALQDVQREAQIKALPVG